MSEPSNVMRTIELADEGATARLGHVLAAALPTQAVVALHGTLGAGKTRLVQAIAEAVGVDRGEVVSPTFVLVQEYHGAVPPVGLQAAAGSAGPVRPRAVPLYHIDAYRLRGPDEFRQLGGEEYLGWPGWVLIEWAERVAECLPPELLEITLEHTGEQTRRARLVGRGPTLAQVVEQLPI